MEINGGRIAEEYVNQLSFRTYLKYWCYPNPCDVEGDGKEICDLLILCRDICVIISVKNYHFEGDYERYKRKVILKSTRQLHGAERKLFRSNRVIKIKHPDREAEEFQSELYSKIYRITINLGDQFEYYDLIDDVPGKGTINIFNKETFDNIVRELDTISDLVEYLNAREDLLKSNYYAELNGKESDLLALFLLNKRSFPIESIEEGSKLVFNVDGAWEHYNTENNHVKDKRLANRQSYFIDAMIERDILKHDWGVKLANELIYLSRVDRRIHAQNLFELIRKHENTPDALVRRQMADGKTLYLYIYYPPEVSVADSDVMLHNAGMIYMYKTDFIYDKIIILGATSRLRQWKYGIVINDGNEMSEDEKKHWEELCKAYGWFENMVATHRHFKEYPNEPDIPILPYTITTTSSEELNCT